MENLTSTDILREMVKINTVNGNEEELAFFLNNLFLTHGINSKLIPYSDGRTNIVAEIGNGQEPILGFDGHMDTVAIGDSTQWTYSPFSAHITSDGKMIGRGTSDMKAGLAAIVSAMIEIKREDININGTIRLLATVGEETGELGAKQLADLGYTNEMESLVVCEPTGCDYITLKKIQNRGIFDLAPFNGEQRFMFVAHKGSINYTVFSNGISAHSSMPELGENAIDSLFTFYARQKAFLIA